MHSRYIRKNAWQKGELPQKQNSDSGAQIVRSRKSYSMEYGTPDRYRNDYPPMPGPAARGEPIMPAITGANGAEFTLWRNGLDDVYGLREEPNPIVPAPRPDNLPSPYATAAHDELPTPPPSPPESVERNEPGDDTPLAEQVLATQLGDPTVPDADSRLTAIEGYMAAIKAHRASEAALIRESSEQSDRPNPSQPTEIKHLTNHDLVVSRTYPDQALVDRVAEAVEADGGIPSGWIRIDRPDGQRVRYTDSLDSPTIFAKTRAGVSITDYESILEDSYFRPSSPLLRELAKEERRIVNTSFSVLSEFHLTPTITAIVDSPVVQQVVRQHGYDSIEFVPPIAAVIDRKTGHKTVAYPWRDGYSVEQIRRGDTPFYARIDPDRLHRGCPPERHFFTTRYTGGRSR